MNTIAERNKIVEEHLHRIDRTIAGNAALMRAAGLDPEDVYQQLAIRLIRCVGDCDTGGTEMEDYIDAQLRDELLDCMSDHSRYGITDMPKGMKGEVISLDDYRRRFDPGRTRAAA